MGGQSPTVAYQSPSKSRRHGRDSPRRSRGHLSDDACSAQAASISAPRSGLRGPRARPRGPRGGRRARTSTRAFCDCQR